MAQRVEIVLTDDLDQGKADGTVTFAYAGTTYEIDLSDANRAKLEKALAPYIGVARKVSSGRRAPVGKRKAGAGASATEIRAWAVAQGMDVSARGRVSSEVREAYENAHA